MDTVRCVACGRVMDCDEAKTTSGPSCPNCGMPPQQPPPPSPPVVPPHAEPKKLRRPALKVTAALLVCAGLAAAGYVLYDRALPAYPRTPEWYLRQALRRTKRFKSTQNENSDKITRGNLYRSIAAAYARLGDQDAARDIARYFEKKEDAAKLRKNVDGLLAKKDRERFDELNPFDNPRRTACYAKVLALNHKFDAALQFAEHSYSKQVLYGVIAMEQHRCGLTDEADKTLKLLPDSTQVKIREAMRAIASGNGYDPSPSNGRQRMDVDDRLAVLHAILARLGRAHYNVFPYHGLDNRRVMGEQLGLCLAAIYDGTNSDRVIQECESLLSKVGVTPSKARMFTLNYGQTWHRIGWILALCGQIDRAVEYIRQDDPACAAHALRLLARTGTAEDLIRMWNELESKAGLISRRSKNDQRYLLTSLAMVQARRGLVGFQRYIIESGSRPENTNIGVLIATAEGLTRRQIWDKDIITPP
ncbi:MAG: hypothetical protein QGG42_16570 [Phycisphaerae bacterium]|nr:hypothetical protein [Phycisphaerae bacterium]